MSDNNRREANATQFKPKGKTMSDHKHELDTAEVGDGLTWRVYTDCHAMTIVKRTAKTITARQDKAMLLNGPNSDAPDKLTAHAGGFAAHVEGVQRYEYEPDADGRLVKFSRRVLKSGQVRWVMVGSGTRTPGNTAAAGRHEHYDYNF